MRYGCDEYLVFLNSVQQCKWIAREDVTAFTATLAWPSIRCFSHEANRRVQLEKKPLSGDIATVAIPTLVSQHFKLSFGVKEDALHPRRKSFALTSSHGMVST